MKAILALFGMGRLCGAGAARAEGVASELEIVHFQGQEAELHSFAYMGSTTWSSDASAFVQKHCTRPPVASGTH